jgi:hypothetical protein
MKKSKFVETPNWPASMRATPLAIRPPGRRCRGKRKSGACRLPIRESRAPPGYTSVCRPDKAKTSCRRTGVPSGTLGRIKMCKPDS